MRAIKFQRKEQGLPMQPLRSTARNLTLIALLSAKCITGIAADDSVEGLFGVDPQRPAASGTKDAPKTTNEPESPTSTDDLFGIEAKKPSAQSPENPATSPTPSITPKESPTNTDELFGIDAVKSTAKPAENPAMPPPAPQEPQHPQELFGKEAPAEAPEVAALPAQPSPHAQVEFSGFWQNELAYTYAGDTHFSKWKNVARLVAKGTLSEHVKWQVSGHLIYDPIYQLNNFYPERVVDNQTYDGYFHETFLDISAGDWEIRLGRQNIVWGEAVGLFFADVVSALDLREFVLPDFELMRIPQCAIRSEYFKDDFHAEFIWIPVATIDEIGQFGGEYFPFNVEAPPGFALQFHDEKKPGSFGEDYAAGTRVSYLKDGWDVALFYHTTPDHTAAFAREIVLAPIPTVTFHGIHQRIHQFGGTLAKDVGETVIKAEAVYTKDRLQTVTTPLDPDGLVESNELRYLIGVDWNIGEHAFNAQFFQTWFQDHQPTMIPDEVESGISLLFRTTAIHPDIEPEVLWVRSLNRNEWLLEAKVSWKFTPDWRWTVGTDVFEGPRNSFLGEFDKTDRVYSEVRFSF